MRIDAAAAGIMPDQFWELTPHEIVLTIRGWEKRDRHYRRILSLIGAGIMRSNGSKVTPRKLMGPDWDKD